MSQSAPTTRPKAPIENQVVDKSGRVTPDWALFFETAGDTSAKGPVLVDSHANRINTNPNVVPYYAPGRFLRYLYFESDTGHLFLCVLTAGVPGWIQLL